MIVIIGVILAMGIPAVTSLTKATSLNSATRTVSSTLNLARQYAITQRTTTRVLYPYNSAGTPADMSYRSYSVIARNPTSLVWEYVGKWEYLPIGAVFGDTITNVGTTTFTFPNLTDSAKAIAYVEFRPTGAATQSGTFTLAEGLVTGGIPTMTSSNRVAISVDGYVGRVKVTRP